MVSYNQLRNQLSNELQVLILVVVEDGLVLNTSDEFDFIDSQS